MVKNVTKKKIWNIGFLDEYPSFAEKNIGFDKYIQRRYIRINQK